MDSKMKNLAKHLAAQGRNGDTHLLHVSSGELDSLRGLGSLVGRPVTTNPDTGLPEAFNFASLIPAIVGIGASVVSGGTLTPLMAGMISGMTTTAVTGDINQGLMAGVTGGAMAGLGSGVAELGATGAGSGVAPGALGSGMADTAGAVAGSAGSAGAVAGSAGEAGGLASLGAGAGGATSVAPAAQIGSGFSDIGARAPVQMPSAFPTAPAGTISPYNPSGSSASNFANNVTDPEQLESAFGGWGSKKLGGNLRGGALALGSLAGAMGGGGGGGGESDNSPSPDAYKKHTTDRTYTPAADSDYPITGSGEPSMFQYRSNFTKGVPKYANGGGIGGIQNPLDDNAIKVIRMIRSRYRSKAAAVADMRTPGSVMQQAGVMSPDDPILQLAFGHDGGSGNKAPQYTAGGGRAGDGMSDSIPATIDGAQPAKLAASEYVIPSDAVSHLGNGSSDAGAEKLQEMVSRIRKARTGTAKQAPQINPSRMLPA